MFYTLHVYYNQSMCVLRSQNLHKQTETYFQTGERAPIALVLDPPLQRQLLQSFRALTERPEKLRLIRVRFTVLSKSVTAVRVQ